VWTEAERYTAGEVAIYDTQEACGRVAVQVGIGQLEAASWSFGGSVVLGRLLRRWRDVCMRVRIG